MKPFAEPAHRHSFVPCARWPLLGICGWYGCEEMGRWSAVLGQYVHLIPASHEANAGSPQIGARKRRERPSA